MLVDPKLYDRMLDPHEKILNEIIGKGREAYRHSKGVYVIAHFNFNHNIADKIFEYPEFDHQMDDFRKRLYAERTERYGKLSDWDQAHLDAGARIPANVETLYRRENWPQPDPDDAESYERYLGAYGVCDSPEQLLSLYDFEADPRKLVISLTHLRKADEPPSGGWRWHKWGPYVGKQKPQCEYLYHEPEIAEIFVYHIYEVL
jgi:hypothetical protein